MTTSSSSPLKNLNMAAIKASLPEYFASNTLTAGAAMLDKSEARANFARALVGAAIERAFSGNFPTVWTLTLGAMAPKTTLLKGKEKAEHAEREETKLRMLEALTFVGGVKAAYLKSPTIEVYQDFASEVFDRCVSELTPPAVEVKEKVKKEGETSKQTIDRLTAELAEVTTQRNELAKAVRYFVSLGQLAPDSFEGLLAGRCVATTA